MGEGTYPGESPDTSRRVKRFTLVVTAALIIGCNALLLGGLWVSGVDLETALSKPELYDPANGHCVRVMWSKIAGADGLVKICTEWLDFSDISGETHVLPEGKTLAMGPDGNLYFSGQAADNYRLIALLIFAIVVMASGTWMKRVLIAKYHEHLQSLEHHSV
ncbi:MAG: hypothetical protein OEY80_14470 [Nitrospirota bacterium]|jgi:hypothetical protein|nr:hypothetical protein [Nitrospirota bacterium]MDH5576687.1 hypothetical protein [Nitrospirota bacterium]